MPKKPNAPVRAELPDGSRIERNHRSGDDGRPVPYGSWYWVAYDPDRRPKRKRVNLRTKDKGAAMIKAADLAARYGMRTFDPWTRAAPNEGVPFVEAAKRFERAQAASGRAPATVKSDRDLLGRLARTLPAGALLRHVEPRHVEAFVNARKPVPKSKVEIQRVGDERSPATKARMLATLRHFAGWSVEKGLAPHDFTQGVEVGRAPAARRDHITEVEEAAILRAISASETTTGKARGWLRDWVVFGTHTGLRPSEQRKLRWSAVRLAERSIEVGKGHSVKTRQSRRTVPVEGPALDVLKRRHGARTTEADGPVFTGANGRAVNQDYLTKALSGFAEAASVAKEVTPYSLRHAFGTRAVAGGVPIYHVAQIMGTSVSMIERHYGHYDPKRGAEALRRLFSRDPTPEAGATLPLGSRSASSG